MRPPIQAAQRRMCSSDGAISGSAPVGVADAVVVIAEAMKADPKQGWLHR